MWPPDRSHSGQPRHDRAHSGQPRHAKSGTQGTPYNYIPYRVDEGCTHA